MKDNMLTEEPKSINKSASWCRPIFLGVLTTLTVGLLLDLLGMGIGFSLFSPTKTALYSLSIGVMAWLLFVSVSSMYSGGWIASYYSKNSLTKTGVFNGIMVSSISILILLALTMSTLGMLVSGSLNGVQYAISSLRSTVTEGASTVDKISKNLAKNYPKMSEKVKKMAPNFKTIIDEVNRDAAEFSGLRNNLDNDKPKDAGEDSAEKSYDRSKRKLEKFIANYLNSIENSGNEEARQELNNFLSEISGKSEAEINEKLDKWKKLCLEAKESARQATIEITKDIAKKLSQFSLLSFFILLSGIVAAVVGGIKGIKQKMRLNL